MTDIKLYTRQEIADILGLHLFTIGHHVVQGHLTPSVVLGGKFGFTEADVLAFVKWHNKRAKTDPRYKLIEWKPPDKEEAPKSLSQKA